MIYIEYYRFVLEPETQEELNIELNAHKVVKVLYHKELDHLEKGQDGDIDLNKVKNKAKKWLKDHYGYVIIYLQNQDEFDKPRKIKYNNLKKFFLNMLEQEHPVFIMEHKQ